MNEKTINKDCYKNLQAARAGLNGILSYVYLPYCTQTDVDVLNLKLNIARAERHLAAAKVAIGAE